MTTTRARTVRQAGVPWVSDGWAAYAETIWETSTDAIPAPPGRDGWGVRKLAPGVALTQGVKHRQGRRLARVDICAVIGAVAAQPYTIHIERLNGVVRDRLACVTRKTHAFAKRAATWDAAVGLLLFEHNWVRWHVAEPEALDEFILAAAGAGIAVIHTPPLIPCK